MTAFPCDYDDVSVGNLSAFGTDAVAEDADMTYETRMMLEEICASVSNVADDFSADVAMFPELFEGNTDEVFQ